jgi:hypothetical protein
MSEHGSPLRILVVQNDVDKGLGRVGDGFYGTSFAAVCRGDT